jgi:cadmium resistance protein CadD (predicted permease)
MSVLSLAVLSVVVFAATNIDDLFVLVGFFADQRFRRSHIVAGQALGIGFLVAVSVVAALVSLVISAPYVGLLGIAPVVIGLKRLWDDEDEFDATAKGRGGGNVVSVALVTVANGGDNIGIYTPLFATQAAWQTWVTVVVFGVMTLLWCAVAGWLVHHPMFGKPIRRYGHRLLPFVLIGVGGLILYEAGSFGLLMDLL